MHHITINWQSALGLQFHETEGVPKMEADDIVIGSLLYGDDERFIGVKNIGHQPTGNWEVSGWSGLQLEPEESSVSSEEPGSRIHYTHGKFNCYMHPSST